jgi:hypothetical protein
MAHARPPPTYPQHTPRPAPRTPAATAHARTQRAPIPARDGRAARARGEVAGGVQRRVSGGGGGVEVVVVVVWRGRLHPSVEDGGGAGGLLRRVRVNAHAAQGDTRTRGLLRVRAYAPSEGLRGLLR